jgi:hypothetical protein
MPHLQTQSIEIVTLAVSQNLAAAVKPAADFRESRTFCRERLQIGSEGAREGSCGILV